LPCCSRV
jgi:hypothetical protein